MLRQIKIRTTILSVLAALAIANLVLLVMVQISAMATHARMTEISSSLFPAALKMQEAETSFERMKKHYGDAVVLQETKSLDSAEVDAEITAKALGEVHEVLESSSALIKQAESVMGRFASIRARDRETYAAILNSKDGPTDALMMQVGDLGKENKGLSEELGALDKAIAADFQRQLDAVNAYAVRSRLTSMGMLFFIVLICAVSAWMIQARVVVPLRMLALRMHDIAEGEGDLTCRIDVEGSNEIDEVGIWFNVFISRMEGIMRHVADHAQVLGTAVAGLAATAHETVSQAGEEQQQAGHITESMLAMSGGILAIHQSTQLAAEDARVAEQTAKDGGETVLSTVTCIQQMLRTNDENSSRIEGLGRSSHAIGKIVGVIDEIAAQTSLLALNASIEAARAGEHGRGFAVVAGEVRRLAERTSSATREIDVTVKAIQESTSLAVGAMRSSLSQVQCGVGSAHAAGDALTSIIRGSESMQKKVSQIALAASEQSATTASVAANVDAIAAIMERTVASSKEAMEAYERLSGMANELTALVGRFKVGAEGGTIRRTIR